MPRRKSRRELAIDRARSIRVLAPWNRDTGNRMPKEWGSLEQGSLEQDRTQDSRLKTDLVPPGTIILDISKPPYEVPCPKCYAFAGEACHDARRFSHMTPDQVANRDPHHPEACWPPTSKILSEPHPIRWEFWEEKPEFRVRFMP